tara:strand:+ start:208 stop:567 length:360 start_codon:yes stop_codon:yes gene_type:complete
MLGYGSANFNQGRYGIGVQQGFVNPASVADVQVSNHVIWSPVPTYSINASSVALIFGGLIQGALVDIQGTSTVYANNVLMRWAGNLDLGSGTSTVYSSGYIAWDSQLVADATWTNQTVS